jgi:ABC-type Zn2+ transport system substrate-binding protein/surface adhesin
MYTYILYLWFWPTLLICLIHRFLPIPAHRHSAEEVTQYAYMHTHSHLVCLYYYLSLSACPVQRRLNSNYVHKGAHTHTQSHTHNHTHNHTHTITHTNTHTLKHTHSHTHTHLCLFCYIHSLSTHPLQKRLAEEVTRFVHGEEGLQQALKATEV